jgi:hypothetical protein
MSRFDDDESATTHLRELSRPLNLPRLERRPVLISLRGELLATPILLERDSVTISGRNTICAYRPSLPATENRYARDKLNFLQQPIC